MILKDQDPKFWFYVIPSLVKRCPETSEQLRDCDKGEERETRQGLPWRVQVSGAREGGEDRTGQQRHPQAGLVMGCTASSRAREQDRAAPSQAD